jgi:hypothetical protein
MNRLHWTPLCILFVLAACADSRDEIDAPTTGADGDTASVDDDDEGGDGNDRFDVGDGMGTAGDDGGGGAAGCEEAQMEVSNQGCLFWAVDLPNSREQAPGGVAESQQFAVVVANNSPETMATVEVYVGGTNQLVDSAELGPEATHTFGLPEASIDPIASSDDGVAYRIEADVPITAYQFNPLDNANKVYSNDATILFPDHVLTEEYAAITDDATNASGTYVSVVATEDDTEVELFPTTDLVIQGAPTAVLDAGEVFTVVSQLRSAGPAANGNLSGTRVVASAPVAVFSGNVSAPVIPSGGNYEGGGRVCCADHMEHQMMPLETWGHAYAVATPAPAYYSRDPARYRIVGAFNGTQLSYAPAAPAGAPTSINAGQTVTFETDQSFSVWGQDDEHPFSIAQFLPSGDTTESIFDDNKAGDPAMIVLPPVAQFEQKYVFAVPEHYAKDFVTLVAPQGAQIQLDGSSVAANLTTLGTVDGTEYGYAHVPANEGPHVLTSDTPVGIVVVGYDVEVSYGYAGGSGFEIIAPPPPPPEG